MEIRVERSDGTRLRPRHAVTRLFGVLLSAVIDASALVEELRPLVEE